MAFFFLFIMFTGAGSSQTREADLLIHDVTIVDVANGKTIPHQSVVVDKGRILDVGTLSIERKYRVGKTVDATGKFAMPGLWDMHVHFGGDTLVDENEKLLPLYLIWGVTSVRDCAGDISLDVLKWKHEIAAGKREGPDIYTSGPKLEGPKSIWPGDLEIANKTELAAALDSLKKLDIDFVKITDNALSPELFIESVREAKKRGWKTSGHVPTTITLEDISAAGLSTIEHLGYALRAATPEEARIARERAAGTMDANTATELTMRTIDTAVAMKNFRLLAAQGTGITPTMNGSRIIAYLDQDDHHRDDELHYLGPELKRTYAWRVNRAKQADAAAIEQRHRNFEASAALLPLIERAGMTIYAGTDAGYLNSFNYPGLGLHQELAMMVKYGLSPRSALAASVINGPAFFGKQKDYGAVAKGKVADILLLSANPLEDIRSTEKIFGLIRSGRYIDETARVTSLVDIAAWVVEKELDEQTH